MANPSRIDPIEFFEFLDGVAQYPTNGYQLSERAKATGYSHDLVHFFEGMPGTFDSEADIMPYAEHLDTPPWGVELDEGQSQPEQLTLDDIVEGDSQADA